MFFPSSPQSGRIEVSLFGLGQLFDSLDPAPFREKSLDREAHRFILDCAEEFDRRTPLTLVIHGPAELSARGDDITQAIHNHFRYEADQSARELRRRTRQGRIAALRGFAVLTLCLVLRRAVVGLQWPGADFLAEGLGILGWVVLWHPLDVLVFERSESREKNYWLGQLSRVAVQFVATAADASLAGRHSESASAKRACDGCSSSSDTDVVDTTRADQAHPHPAALPRGMA